jgi:hypothetical protein
MVKDGLALKGILHYYNMQLSINILLQYIRNISLQNFRLLVSRPC